MSIQTDNIVTREDILQKFEDRIKPYLSSQSSIVLSRTYTGATRVWDGTPGWPNGHTTDPSDTWAFTTIPTLNATAGAIIAASGTSPVLGNNSPTSGSAAPGAVYSGSTVLNDTIPVSAFGSEVNAGSATGQVVAIVKEFLRLSAKAHMAAIRNTGNLLFSINGGPQSFIQDSGVVMGTVIPTAAVTLMHADVDAYVGGIDVENGGLLQAENFNNLIEKCRDIWAQRCTNSGTLSQYNFYYCHNSCHSNVTCYSSRGRR